MELAGDSQCHRAVEQLIELQRRGIRIRSRALITTLWARLALGDLFIHGIGGAKYDWVTDRLIERFFGLRPPGLMVLSATLLLPIEREPADDDQLRSIRHQLRELSYHPERFLDGATDGPAELIAEKRRWLNTPQTVENARGRCHAIRDVNAALQSPLATIRQQLEQRLAAAERRLQGDSVLAWREYAYCLYPENMLREFFQQATSQNGLNMV